MAGSFKIGIIGAGFSGKMLAAKLLANSLPDSPIEIYLIDSNQRNGVAYSTPDGCHLLNVRAANMSALNWDQSHFVNYLNTRFGDEAWGPKFLSRKIYSEYLESIFAGCLSGKESLLEIVTADVLDVSKKDSGLELILENRSIYVDHCVLAYGNIHQDAATFNFGAVSSGTVSAKAPWPYSSESLSKPNILFVGTGLTAVDLALSAARLNPAGQLFAVSRNGLLPAVHAASNQEIVSKLKESWGSGLKIKKWRLLELLREMRTLSLTYQWRDVIDSIRPFTQEIWRGFSEKEKKTFLKRLNTFWSIHRHRVSPEVNAQLQALVESKKLVIIPAKIISTSKGEAKLIVNLVLKNGELQKLEVDEVISCTGPSGLRQLSSIPLFASLLKLELIKPDFASVGLSMTDSLDQNILFTKIISALGPPLRGELLECTSVPELRVQVEKLAQLLQSHTGN
jgi:uncharacterized NAD(P)/FAD-binding protein YdhS